jgi:hypothetical protein
MDIRLLIGGDLHKANNTVAVSNEHGEFASRRALARTLVFLGEWMANAPPKLSARVRVVSSGVGTRTMHATPPSRHLPPDQLALGSGGPRWQNRRPQATLSDKHKDLTAQGACVLNHPHGLLEIRTFRAQDDIGHRLARAFGRWGLALWP